MSKEAKETEIDIKEQYEELVKKYEKLEQTHNTYKFDVEFNSDISDIKSNIDESDLNVLKELKRNNNQEAYNLLLNQYKKPVYTYKPSDGTDNTNGTVDLFTREINRLKGV